jgi:hypothetical protein
MSTTWCLRPSLLAMVVSVAALAAVAAASTTEAASDNTPQVVVTKSGLMLGGAGSDYAEYGLVLRNRSRTTDALAVTVKVQGLDGRGRAFTSGDVTITVIPAGTSFVLGGSLVWNVSIDLKRIAAVVRVGKTVPKGRKLPPVKRIGLASNGDVTGLLTNPYRKPLPSSATIYGVFLDSAGRIVASAGETTDATIAPGQTVPFDLFGNLSATARMAVASALVTVDPCGYQAFTRACPIRSTG